MLLDYGSSWLGGHWKTRLQPLFPDPVVLQYRRIFLFLHLALQSDSQKPFDFGLLLFALQGFQNVRIRIVVQFETDESCVFFHPIPLGLAVCHLGLLLGVGAIARPYSVYSLLVLALGLYCSSPVSIQRMKSLISFSGQPAARSPRITREASLIVIVIPPFL